MTVKFVKSLLKLIAFIMVVSVIAFGIAMAKCIWQKPEPATPCEEIPRHSIVIVPGFLHLDDKKVCIIPGTANERIAHRLEECADRIEMVLTQRAVSNALKDSERLKNGTPVKQMHAHDSAVNVRTYAAIQAALNRLETTPARVVLLAHPRHLSRSRMDLESMFSGEIVLWHAGEIGYQDGKWYRGLQWSLKNFGGWVVDFALIASTRSQRLRWVQNILKRLFGGAHDVPEYLRLPKLTTRGQ